MSTDTIVIGGGHNGLSAAITLQKAGRHVLLLEARAEVGGFSAPRKFHEGFTAPGVYTDTDEIRPGLIDALNLGAHGLKLRSTEVPVFAPEKNGKGVLISNDPEKSAGEMGPDAAGYRELCRVVDHARAALNAALNEAPPPLLPVAMGEFLEFAKLGLKLRTLGEKDFYELLRMLTMCAGDLLRDHFKRDVVMAALAQGCITGEYVGPWSAGTAARLLMHRASSVNEVEGGPAALVAALSKSFASLGGQTRTRARVAEVLVEKGRAVGVRLEGGETLKADLVGCAIHPKRALLELVSPRALSVKVRDQVRAYRSRGCSAKVHLALNAPIVTKSRPGELFEHLRIGESLDELEHAFDAVKYRELSALPGLDIRQPTVADESLAPKEKHVASIWVNFAPYQIDAGWNDASRAKVLENVLSRIAAYDPDIRGKVVGSEVLDPVTLEQEYGAVGGNIFKGELGLDQLLFMRPAPALAHYTTPVPGLFLCGSGSHPGGGVTLACGALGARAGLAAV